MYVRVFISLAHRKWRQILLRCIMKRQDPMDTTLTAVRHIPTSYKENILPNEGGQVLHELAEREVVESALSGTVKICLDRVPSNLTEPRCQPCFKWGLN